jgi:NAD(P)-dependent dehydrogenase (short-subunit alcohol dehydrogenase family)
MEPGDWDKVIGSNLNSVFYTCRLFVPSMVKRQSGRIINISSVWGNVGASCEVAYSASKGGVNSFTRGQDSGDPLKERGCPRDGEGRAVSAVGGFRCPR